MATGTDGAGSTDHRRTMRIGFIGTGHMGGAIAGRLQSLGYRLVVHDVREEATRPYLEGGATLGTNPRDVAQACDVVFTSLPGPREVETVALGPLGIIEGLHPGMVYIDLSTSTPALIRKIGARFATSGVDVLDAPVSGGVWGARDGTLSVFAGGDEPVFQRMQPILMDVGNRARYCGPLGAGEVVKICNNLLSLSMRALVPEAFALGIKAGVSPRTLFEALSGGVGRSNIVQGFEQVLAGGDRESWYAGVILKDLRLALDLGGELGVPLEMARAAERRHAEAWDRGYGEHPVTLLEEQAGVKIRGSIVP